MRIRGKDMHIHFVTKSGNGWTLRALLMNICVILFLFDLLTWQIKAKLNSAMKGKALAAAALALALLTLGEGGSTSSKLQSMQQMNGTYGLVTGL